MAQTRPEGFDGGGERPPLPAAPSTNGFAIASLVLGILWLWWIGSVLALVFGYIGKNQIERSKGMQGGQGMAIAGIVLGWVGLATLLLMLVLMLTGVFSMPSMPMMDQMMNDGHGHG